MIERGVSCFMSTSYSHQFGWILRKIRNDKGLAMKYFEDQSLSQATISKIENGNPHVSAEKVKLYAKRLGYDLEELSKVIKQEQEQQQFIRLQLFAVETYIDLIGEEQGLCKLKEIDGLNRYDRFKPHVDLLKGKYYYQKKDWQKAKTYFLRSVMHVNQSNEWKKSNIKPASLNELSRIAYMEGNLEEAMRYVQEGLNAFEQSGSREHIIYSLITNQAIYLDKLGLLEKSLEAIHEFKQHLNGAKSMEATLSILDLEAKILRNTQMYSKAICLVEEGIELARVNSMYDKSATLWISLGNIYYVMQKFDQAKICYLTSLDLQEKGKKKHPILSIYKQLGLIYEAQNNLPLAKKYLKKAIYSGKNTDDMLQYTESFIAYGDFLRKQGQYMEAIEQYEQGLQLAKTYQFKELEEELWVKQGDCWMKLGNDEKYQQCTNQLHLVKVLLLDGGE